MRRGSVGFPLIAFLFVPLIMAQQDNDLRISIDSLGVSGDQASITMTVTDRQRQGISGLDSTAFEVQLPVIDSTLVPSCSQSEEGSALVLCIDNSGLMPVEKVVDALVDYMGSIRPQDRVAVVAFNDSVEIVSTFSGNITHLRSRIGELGREGSKTELYQGVYAGLRMLRDNTPAGLERRYLLVFSDGRNEYYDEETYNLDHCINLANEIGVPIISVAFDSSYSALSSMDLMSDRTGGFYTEVLSREQIGQAFISALRILDSQYFIEFAVPDTLRDSFEHEFTIQVRSGLNTGRSTIGLTFQAPPPVDGSKGISFLLLIVLFILLLIIIAVIYYLVKRGAQRKIDILNDELLSKNDMLTEMERETARKAMEKDNAAEMAAKTSGKQDRSRFRKTMIGEAPSAKYGSATLAIENGSNGGSSFKLEGSVIKLGHQADNDIQVDPEPPSGQSTVSRHHAVIKNSGGEFIIQDKGSTNGTFVNGRQIQNSPLTDGDIIKLGKIQLRFRGEQ